MVWIRAIVLSLSTYTRIPMPRVKWDEKAMKLSIVFLPLAGLVTGLFVYLWWLLANYLNFSPVLFASGALVLSALVTGGIHLDGFCDTSDALASWQEKERRLEILKDPTIGAFALIRMLVYFLLSFGIYYEIYSIYSIDSVTFSVFTPISLLFLYPLSRVFASWSAMTMKNARKDGMLASFSYKYDKKKAIGVLVILSIAFIALWVYFTYPYGLLGIVFLLLLTFWYKKMTCKFFGGITGDTTGYYIQLVELLLLANLLIGGLLERWL